MYSLTVFKNMYDTKTHRKMVFGNLETFEHLFYVLSKEKKKGKKYAELISPAIYENGFTRSNKGVLAWGGWAAVDVDDFKFAGNLKDELIDRFGEYRFLCYSTASSTVDQAKFRLVFPLTGEVKHDNIKAFWYALNTEIGSLGDKQTKDLSRMYYIPAKYHGANNFIFTHDSDNLMDPDIIMKKHPYQEKKSNSFLDNLPESVRNEIIAHRKEKMNNTSISWSSYLDCPFWPKKLSNEYLSITESGWYHKMYQIMVACANNAIKQKYPITSNEIANMCKDFDASSGGWYSNRPLEKEAERAIEYVYGNDEF